MQQISVVELSFAYLFAAGLIAGLVFLAHRNRKQGWRKNRDSWLKVQSAAALRAFESKADSPQPFEHLGDLDRLSQSLTAHGEPQRPEPEPEPEKVKRKDGMLA